jgi:hypothetical protein
MLYKWFFVLTDMKTVITALIRNKMQIIYFHLHLLYKLMFCTKWNWPWLVGLTGPVICTTQWRIGCENSTREMFKCKPLSIITASTWKRPSCKFNLENETNLESWISLHLYHISYVEFSLDFKITTRRMVNIAALYKIRHQSHLNAFSCQLRYDCLVMCYPTIISPTTFM